jgi:hypothetical protein
MGLNRRARRAATLGAIALVTLAWSGCSGKKQTELVAGVTSQVQVPRDFRSVRIDVNGAFGNTFCRTYPVYDGKVRLPRTLGVLSGGDPSAPVTITVAGYVQDSQDGSIAAFSDCLASPEVGKNGRNVDTGGGARVMRRSRQPYVPDRILYLPMPLHYSCYDVDCECGLPDDTKCPRVKRPECSAGDCTCKGGKCVSPDITTERLVDYDDDLVFGSSNTCFRPFITTDDKGNKLPGCLDDGVPPQLVDAKKCIYVLPETASAAGLPPFDAGFPLPEPETHGAGLNVRVVYDNIVSEVLDYEGPCTQQGPSEGYCTPDPSKPQMFQLAASLCHPEDKTLSDSPHRITLMTASGLCPSKTELQPICDDSVQGPPQPTLIDGGSSADGSCNVGLSLKPAQSALYILMDKASGMRQFLGSSSVLAQVIGLPLSDPVFKNTLVGFKFLEDPALTCTSVSAVGDNAKLDIPFDPSKTVQSQQAVIADRLAKTSADLTSPPPPMLLDAVLQPTGAYNVIQSLSGDGGAKQFNRRAVLLLIDRDATNDCASSLDAISEAATAHAGGIFTYVVVLGNEDLVDASAGVPPHDLADKLAVAGGAPSAETGGAYHVYASDPNDKTSVIVNANKAIKTIADDLGSCVYETPAQVTTAAKITVTVIDQGALKQQELTYSTTACNDTDTNKWVLDHGRIRICEKPCADFREALKATAFAAEIQQPPQSPPDLSPTILEPCDAPPGPPVTDGAAAAPDAGAGFDAATPLPDAGAADAPAGG